MTDPQPVKDLEGVDRDALVSASGVAYRDFRSSLTPRYGAAWIRLAAGHAMLGLTAFTVARLGDAGAFTALLGVGLGSALIGYALAYLSLFLHEAAHQNLARSRVWNDRLADLAAGVFVGESVAGYRDHHFEHHRELGRPGDPEHSYFEPLDARFLVESLLGVRALRVARERLSVGGTRRGGRRVAVSIGTCVLHGSVVVGSALAGSIPLALAWSIGTAGFLPFFSSLRQLLEHRDEDADARVDYSRVAHGPVNRLFGDGPISSTFGGAGFNRHLLHHWEPAVPFTRLRELERAYLGGLRLVVQHATSNRVICEMVVGEDIQPVRYACDDMVAVDRIIEETYAMERYIDAQFGGPGEGFFRVVTSPEEARRIIDDGKMAVVLGIEVSNLFGCRLTPRPGEERCDEATMLERLDRYRDLGVRAIFPIHKYDNAFGSGDGDRNIIELGAFINSGHWSNYTQTCPNIGTAFDRGPLAFGGLNMPRDDYLADAPNDFSGFAESPVASLAPFLGALTAAPLEGDWCLNAGMTPLGMALVEAMMDRGMILEIDHLGRQSYVEVLERLEEEGYPAAGTHGVTAEGRVYALGGISKTSFRGCADPMRSGTMVEPFLERAAAREAEGFLGAEGFGFDLNGFAGARRPRFGERSRCGPDQPNPMSYPFTSYDGRVTFTRPEVGERELDYDTEGMVHLGLVAEVIEDVRRDGATDEDLEPLFRSAEAYLQMWELAERRATERAER